MKKFLAFVFAISALCLLQFSIIKTEAAPIAGWQGGSGYGVGNTATSTGTYLQVASTSTLSYRLVFNGNHYDPRNYGAKFDGVTDDTVALQNAINASCAGGAGSVLELPAGTTVAGQLDTCNSDYWEIRGQGYGATIVSSTAATSSLLVKTGADFFKISGIWIKARNTTNGLFMSSSTFHNNFDISFMRISDARQDNMYLGDPGLCSVHDNFIEDSLRDGIFVEIGTSCTFWSNYMTGNDRSSLHFRTATYMTFFANASEYTNQGYLIENSGNITGTANGAEVQMDAMNDGTVVAPYHVANSKNITLAGNYTSKYAYLHGRETEHIRIVSSTNVSVNNLRGKAVLGGADPGEAPTYLYYISSSTAFFSHMAWEGQLPTSTQSVGAPTYELDGGGALTLYPLSGCNTANSVIQTNASGTFTCNDTAIPWTLSSPLLYTNPGVNYVGIGNTAPSSTLHVSGLSTSTLSLDNSALPGGKRFDFRVGAVASGSLDLFDFTSSTSRLFVASSGMIGVGTTTPSQMFQVQGNGMFRNVGTTSLYIIRENTAQFASLIFGQGTTDEWQNGLRTDGTLDFFIRDAVNGRNAFRATQTGLTGIGVNAQPSSTLHVIDPVANSSTVKIGGTNKNGCLEMGSASGTVGQVIYVWFDSNAQIYSSTTKPQFCQ